MSAERDLLQRMLDDLDENGLSGDVFYAIMDDARALLATPEEPRSFTRADIERLVAKVSAFDEPHTIWVGYTRQELVATLCAAAGLEAR